MTLAIGDKVRLKPGYWVEWSGDVIGTSLFTPLEFFAVRELLAGRKVRISPNGVEHPCVYASENAVEKVEDKPVNERVMRTMYVNGVSEASFGEYLVSLRGDNRLDGFMVDSETAKTIRVGDEFEVIIRRK